MEPNRSAALQTTEGARRSIAWDRILIVFMRVMAALWIAKGLSSWLIILGMDPTGAPQFEVMPVASRAVVIVFAVLDLVAGVGLWLTSTWGGVMWLLAIMSDLLVGSMMPVGLHMLGLGTVFAEAGSVFAYIVLSWLAAREA